MAKIGFIGLGHMGAPMAENLLKNGHALSVFDLMPEAVEDLAGKGAMIAISALDAAQDKDYVITMLPESRHVQGVYLGENGLIQGLKFPTFFIDCSTIDVTVSRDLHGQAMAQGHRMLDAPVSGGVTGAANATLTFMVGGEDVDFEQAKPLFQAMGKNIFHTGQAGTGQAVKICNNLMLAVHMLATSEAFVLAEKLGLDHQKLFDVASASSGQSWSLTSYCPVPGPVPTSPANRDYAAGFTAAMMLKDLGLAYQAAQDAGTDIPMAHLAKDLYQTFCDQGGKSKDFSGIIEVIRHTKSS